MGGLALYLALLFLSILLILLSMYTLVTRYARGLRKQLVWYLATGAAILLWIAGRLVYFLSPDPYIRFLAQRLGALGNAWTVVLFLATVLHTWPQRRRWVRWIVVPGLVIPLAIELYLLQLPYRVAPWTWNGLTWTSIEQDVPVWLWAFWSTMVLGLALVALVLYFKAYGRALAVRPWYIRGPVYLLFVALLILEVLNAFNIPPWNEFSAAPALMWLIYLLLVWGGLRTLFEATPTFSPKGVLNRVREGVLVFDVFHKLVDWNQQAQQFLNLDPETSLHLSFQELQKRHPWLQEVPPGVDSAPRVIEGDGRVWEVETVAINDQRGAPLGWILLLYDLTEHLQLNQMLQYRTQSEMLYRYLTALSLMPHSGQEMLCEGGRLIFQALESYGLKALALYLVERGQWRQRCTWGAVPETLALPEAPPVRPTRIGEGMFFPLMHGKHNMGGFWAQWHTDGDMLPLEETLTQAVGLLTLVYVRKQEEERLRLLDKVYNTVREGVFLFNREFQLVDMNPAAHTMSGGWEVHEQPTLRALFPDAPPEESLARQLLARGHWEGKLTLQPKEGKTLRVEASMSVVQGENVPVMFTLVARDITQREALEQALERERRLLKGLFHTARSALAAPLDVQVMFEATARAVHEVTAIDHIVLAQLHEGEHLGRVFVFTTLPHPPDEEQLRRWLQQALQDPLFDPLFSERRPVYLADLSQLPGTAPLVQDYPWRSLLVYPLHYGGRLVGLLLLSHNQPHAFDHADRDLLQGMAEILVLALRQSELYHGQVALAEERLRAREEEARLRRQQEQFLANITHEMRTPLQAILGYLEWLDMSFTPETPLQEVREELTEIRNAAQHLLDLVNQLLEYQKAHVDVQLNVRPFKVRELLAELVPLVKPLMAHNRNEYHVSVEPEDLEMTSDPNKIQRILLNLLSNAAKFTHQGKVAVQVRLEERDGEEWVRIEVQDTGIGIPDHMIPHIFKPFAQAGEEVARRYGGTGLGLALVQEYVSLLGGRVEVQSQVGRGTTFTVWLPRRLEVEAPTPQRQQTTSPSSGGNGAPRRPPRR